VAALQLAVAPGRANENVAGWCPQGPVRPGAPDPLIDPLTLWRNDT
jgi:hypothetical protein